MKKISTLAILCFAAALLSCGKSVTPEIGTWIFNTPDTGTSTLVIKKADKDSLSFYIESERKEVYRTMEGTALRDKNLWVFDLEKFEAQNKAAASAERKGAYFEKGGFRITFEAKEAKGKIVSIAVTGDNDGSFFKGTYTFLNASVENPKPAIKVIDGYYRKAGDPLVLDIYLNAGKISERRLEKGEVMGGRELGTFSFVGSEMIVCAEDPATGGIKKERWAVVDDNTLKDPSGTLYTFYMP